MSKAQAYKEYLTGSDWQLKRSIALRLANYKCNSCNSSKHLDVHHLQYGDWYSVDPAEDLVVLCRGCHKDAHVYKCYVSPPKARAKGKRSRKLTGEEKVYIQDRLHRQDLQSGRATKYNT